jgi:hypothetical protein
MITALIWNNEESYRQHLEHMKMFRRTHQNDLKGKFTRNDIRTSSDIHPQDKTGKDREFVSARGKPVLIPVWEIVPPRGSQN